MEEMQYKTEYDFKILYDEDRDGYKIVIVSLGSHPCAYISVPKGHLLYGENHDEIDNLVEAHGGLTYSNFGVSGIYEDLWFFGWDYAHSGDYVSNLPIRQGKQWITQEIYVEALDVLENIKKIKRKEKICYEYEREEK